MQEGRRWLKETFGDTEYGNFKLPHVAWHLDAFGHSGVYAHLLQEMGLDSWVFARLNRHDQDNLFRR